MIRRISTVFIILSISLLVGCTAPSKMAFHDDSVSPESIKNPIFLMTATLRNDYKTSHQPKLLAVNLEKAVEKGRGERIIFNIDEKSKQESDDPAIGNKYLLRMELESGEYVVRGLTSMSSSFIIRGFFFTPIHEMIKSSEPGIYYLGNIHAVIRERSGKEFKAGPSIPLLDQALIGASGGTYDIKITDQWDIDGPEFKKTFPFLGEVDVKKRILSEFNRERAQKWWEDH